MDLVRGIFAWLAKEGRVILDAPVSFLLSVSVVGVGLFFILKAFFKERIAVLGERLQHAQGLVTEYKNKLPGATPDEAARAVRELQERVKALEPRRLTDDQRYIMRAILGSAKAAVLVAHDGASADASGYSAALSSLFRELGWTISTAMVIAPSMQPESGIAVLVPDPRAVPTAGRLVIEALRAAQIQFEVYSSKLEGCDVELLITAPVRR